MKENTKKKKIAWGQYIGIGFFMLIGAVCGVLFVQYMESAMGGDKPLHEELLTLAVLFVGMYVGMFVQIVIHEGGHLVFGLLSGYKFSSFRIFSIMFLKENGKIKLKRLSIAGTGGQCLMTPPDMVDGKIPVVLYNLGGSIMNVIASVIFWALSLVLKGIPLLSTLLLIFAIVGIGFAITNGVPLRMGMVDNDGYNAFSLSKNPAAMRAFWLQLKINDQNARGVRLKDMPEEWFELPAEEDMKNSLVATIAVFVCNRLMDAHEFEEADKLMARLIAMESGIIGLHRNLMIADRMYLELIGESRSTVIEGLLTKEQKKFMKQMKNFLSVIRTEYAYALLYERDAAKAEKIKLQFEKAVKSYPYASDIESERELLEFAVQKA